jgi:hypothetical protein
MRKYSRIWAVLGLLILTICLWGCGDKAGTTTEKKEGANSLSKSDYGKYMDAYLDYANAHENDHAGYDCGYAMTLDAADYPVLVMIYLKADQNSSDDDYYDEYDSDYSDERSEAGSPYMYWDFLGYKNGEVERIEELTASEDERVIINCDGIVAKRKDSSEGQIYLLKKGKWQELYSYAIDGSQGVALAYINSKDGKQTVKFQDEDGNLTTANDYEKEIKKLFRTIYGKNEYYTEVIQNMTLYELLADDTVAVSPVLYAEKKDAFDDYNEAAIVYSKMQFQTIISDMKEQWIHTQDGLYSYLVDDRYRMVKPDRFYEFDCKGLLRRDLNWIKDTKFVEEADGGFFCEWLSDWASDYLDNEYINDDTYKIFSDMEDNAWIGNKLGMGDKTGEADQDDTDTETNDDEIVLTVDEKKEMLSSFVQWFYSEERHSKLAAWNDLTGASSPLIGYWQGEHIGMAVMNYTDIKYGGLYFYILNTLEDGRIGYTKIYEGNAEKITLVNAMDLKLEDDTHITLSYEQWNGEEEEEYSESLTKGEVPQTVLDEYAGKWIDVFGEKSCIDISFDSEQGDININGENTNDSPEKAENTYLYSSDGVLVCLASDVTQAYDSEYGSFPQYATTTLTLNDDKLSYEVEGYYDDRTDNEVSIDENGYGYERVPEGEEPWETAYRNYMEYIEDSKCALFYLNDDDIPEIYFYDTGYVGTYEDGSVHIYENVNGYGDKSVCRIQPNTLVYAPRSNKFVTTKGSELEGHELNGEKLEAYNGCTLNEGKDPNDYQHGISFLAEDNLTGEKVIFYDTVEAAKKALMGN